MVFTAGRAAPRRRERSNGESHGGLSSGRISRALLDSGEPPVLAASAPGAPADVVQVALSRGGEDPRSRAGRGGQVSAAEEVPVAEDDLGRGGGGLLLQGTLEERVEGVLHEEQVPGLRREEESSEEDRSDAHPGIELVQKSKTEGSNAADENVSSHSFFFSFSKFRVLPVKVSRGNKHERSNAGHESVPRRRCGAWRARVSTGGLDFSTEQQVSRHMYGVVRPSFEGTP